MKEIEAFIYEQKIGTLLNYKGTVYFEYDESFKNLGLEISPIKLHTSSIHSAHTNTELPVLYNGLPGVFYDSLPDKHGMAFIDRYFERQGLKSYQITNLHKLAFIGDRGMGAIEYRPVEHEDICDTNMVISAKNAHDQMQKYIDDKNTSISNLMNILDSVSPVGGRRPKMLIQYNEISNILKLNRQKLEKGFKRAILKFDETYYENESIGLTKLEYVFMSMAKDAGVDTAEFTLIEEEGLHHLIVTRFDRDKDDHKVHMCTASSLAHIDFTVPQGSSYEMLFRLTYAITKSQEDIEELFRRMVFNVLAFNFDDHSKNFAYLMNRSGKWKLSPAYDITYSKGEAKQHITTICGKSIEFTLADLLTISKSYLIKDSKALEIIQKVIEVMQTFKNRAYEVNMDEEEISNCWDDIQSQIVLLQQSL